MVAYVKEAGMLFFLALSVANCFFAMEHDSGDAKMKRKKDERVESVRVLLQQQLIIGGEEKKSDQRSVSAHPRRQKFALFSQKEQHAEEEKLPSKTKIQEARRETRILRKTTSLLQINRVYAEDNDIFALIAKGNVKLVGDFIAKHANKETGKVEIAQIREPSSGDTLLHVIVRKRVEAKKEGVQSTNKQDLQNQYIAIYKLLKEASQIRDFLIENFNGETALSLFNEKC